MCKARLDQVAFKKVSSDVFQKRGELRPPHPLAATRLYVALRRRPPRMWWLAADSAERSAARVARAAEILRGCGGIIPPLSFSLFVAL